ncbi:ORMDL family protein [Schizosaccharomyces pombe]|uniref:Uncharacterized protein C119.09c n=1 Tax=Schizosaccharomyces pombe (strain 972 / ATCC 24843) TaxID=284812 RepID=YBA9_SCHPO|nr:putative ORMDL family protein [Schizosaccharomyces pombe]O42901.3 RecName: Full=Uncharacterized protein C119.09c [Schizosaccharomyces pombe 972h-]CAA17924.1 ORMDL family protein (predicted) [Schizosaccharomyces pombe]|eukprot:NP_595290.1 putative ORMDL family protein [Schizosaccharomyces pombe]
MGSSSSRRRSSSLVTKVPKPTIDDRLDQGSATNYNSNWVNYKGAWVIHIVLIAALRLIFHAIPSVSRELAWTLTNLTYMAGSFIMFHWVTGTPFEFNGGAYDRLTMWEQLDEGNQYTPARKYLLVLPIILFLMSTHYTHYNGWMFLVNIWALFMVLIPKLPAVHRKRIFGIQKLSLRDDDNDSIPR